MKPEFFSKSWCGLNWTSWIPLNAPKEVFREIPTSSGVYRVRPQEARQLAYIGQTGRGLRERLRTLSIYTYGDEMPFNDPHTAAPGHWVLRVENGMTFECSAAPTGLGYQERQCLEDMLLWKHRVEFGESTLCNHGRFHPNYSRSGSRKSGKRGEKLPLGEINLESGSSAQSLQLNGKPQDSNWMGLSWSRLEALRTIDSHAISEKSGLYKILDVSTHQLLYVGETRKLRNRIKAHSLRSWGHFEPLASYHAIADDVLDHQLREMETDLIGSYYEISGKPPVFQYGKKPEQLSDT